MMPLLGLYFDSPFNIYVAFWLEQGSPLGQEAQL